MLRRLSLRDFVIVEALDVELDTGFSVLTGETGAGKSILIDALQLALGSRGDAGVVREGASRAEIGAEFDVPASLAEWLEAAGFEAQDTLLLRRTIDAQGKSRAWINGSAATIAQLREAADHLVDIHGQHAWQSLTRGPSVRALLDAFAGVEAAPLGTLWSHWKHASEALAAAGTQQAGLERERERLAWQIGEVDKLAPAVGEWAELEAEHKKLANGQALIDAARMALDALANADDAAGENAASLTARALHALEGVSDFDNRLASTIEVLGSVQAQLQDAAHTLGGYLHHADLEPQRLQALDERLSAWMTLARRYRRPPDELPALLAQWKDELRTLDAAADLDALQHEVARALAAFAAEAKRVSARRRAGAPKLASAVTHAMQQLGMAGGRFEVALLQQDAPQSFGLESAEFLVAGHAGSTPRPLGKVASGGELSRIALAIAVTTSQLETRAAAARESGGEATASTLIFDEIDAGVGGAVAETVGRLMKQLGRDRQVLAVTHLPQVAACADHHFVVSKQLRGGLTVSAVSAVSGEVRVAEVARMLGGERLSNTSLAHAQEMLAGGAEGAPLAGAAAGAPLTGRGRKR
jgi:DNA repair protein RecN (Recombination protein N)